MEPVASSSSAQYTPPPASEWPNHPVLITEPVLDGDVTSRTVIPLHRPGPNANSEFNIESGIFIGKMYIAIKGIDNFPEKYFSGKRRLFNIVVQGMFKRSGVPFSSVHTGQMFSGPLHLIPPPFLLAPFRFLLEKLQPSLKMELAGPRPYVISPLMSTMQAIVVSRPGEEPAISSNLELAGEDLSLVSPELAGMSSSRRKAFFSRADNLSRFTFDTNLVYTFNFYQDLLDMSTFEVSLGFISIDISRFLGRLPVSIMAVVCDLDATAEAGEAKSPEPEYMYHLEVWHEKSFGSHE